MSGSAGAQQAAELIGPQIGVDPSIIYGQFVAEDGSGLNPAGSYNYGNLQPGGQEASYSSPAAFALAFVKTIKDNFSGAENTGSNAAAYTAGLFPASGQDYEQGVTQAQYLANIQAGASQMTTASAPAQTPENYVQQRLQGDSGGNSAVAGQAAAATAGSNNNPLGTLANFLGIDVGFYDIGLIILGSILVLGAILFISKPAVQSVTVQASKLAKAAVA